MTRVLALVNEVGPHLQFATRRALAQLTRDGQLSSYEVFSYLEAQAANGARAAARMLLDAVLRVNPDVLLVQHPDRSFLDRRIFADIRRLCAPRIVYYEGDPYRPPWHGLPAQAVATARAADIVFTVGDDRFRENLRRAGASDVRWTPHRFDPWRIPPAQEARDRSGIVMIANRSRARLPWRHHPGWRDRKGLVAFMSSNPEFAVYGAGWSGAAARGPVAFERQQDIIATAKVSLNWDHYASEAMYFSNRLPISMAVGSLHVTTRHPGLQSYLAGVSSVFLCDTPEEVAGTSGQLNAVLSQSEVLERIETGRDFAYRHLRADDLVVELLLAAGAWPERPEVEWDLSIPYLPLRADE